MSKQRLVKKDLTSGEQVTDSVLRDRSGVTCGSACVEVSLKPFRAVTSSFGRIVIVCSSAVDCNFFCDSPGSCYGRAVFIGDELAAPGCACSFPAHREGAILGPVRRRPLPGILGSIDQREYCGYATRSKPFLFRSFLSGQWTALGSRWTP